MNDKLNHEIVNCYDEYVRQFIAYYGKHPDIYVNGYYEPAPMSFDYWEDKTDTIENLIEAMSERNYELRCESYHDGSAMLYEMRKETDLRNAGRI